MNKENRIGVTESNEIAYNLDAFDRLYKGNIIITKRLTDKLIEKLIEYKDKIILHLTVTGMGSTRIEPFVPSPQTTLEKLQKLINGGFPTDHIVLRVDPIVPTERGIETALDVIAAFGGLGIGRLRFSFLDNYKHVKKRFRNVIGRAVDRHGIKGVFFFRRRSDLTEKNGRLIAAENGDRRERRASAER